MPRFRSRCSFAHGGDALVAILAVLKAGRFYVVLDPHYPTDRLRYMLADSGAAAMVCDAMHHEAGARAVRRCDRADLRLRHRRRAAIRSSLPCGRDRTASR
jgi:non-ribosomal peptide synthetase component F